MSNYNNFSEDLKKASVFGGVSEPENADALDASGARRTPYLTITNKSTSTASSTSVNFEIFLFDFDEFLLVSSRFIRSFRAWLVENKNEGFYGL